VLAAASIGVLVFFIHHVSLSIQAPILVANVGGELLRALDRVLPEKLGEGGAPADAQPDVPPCPGEAAPVCGKRGGYLQAIDADGLMELAAKHDLRIWLARRPGEFVVSELPLMHAHPRDRITDEIREALSGAFILGPQRTPEHDVEFNVHQLVEIAVRALSPGINDPFTAINCIDWLGQALCKLCGRRFPSPLRYDDENRLRVVAKTTDFAGVVDAAFNQIRQYGAGSVAVTLRLLECIAQVAACARTDEQRAALMRHARMIAQPDEESFSQRGDRADLRDRVAAALGAIGEPPPSGDGPSS